MEYRSKGGDRAQGSGTIKSTEKYYAQAAACYLAHVEQGQSIRSIAVRTALHPSTILRRIRKIEAMRDDPIVDSFLASAAGQDRVLIQNTESEANMTAQNHRFDQDGAHQIKSEEKRILRRMCETGAFLAVSKDLQKAVVMRQGANGAQTRTAVVDARLAGALTLNDWLRCSKSGRVTCYKVTSAGRAALKRMLAADEQKKAVPPGFSEAPSVFSEQHKDWGERHVTEKGSPRPRKLRVNLAESPLTILARKKDKSGQPFLSQELLAAGERLREDFELAQIGPRIAQNWERFLTVGGGQFRVVRWRPVDGPFPPERRLARAWPRAGRYRHALLLFPGRAGSGGKAYGMVGALRQDRFEDRAATAERSLSGAREGSA